MSDEYSLPPIVHLVDHADRVMKGLSQTMRQLEFEAASAIEQANSLRQMTGAQKVTEALARLCHLQDLVQSIKIDVEELTK